MKKLLLGLLVLSSLGAFAQDTVVEDTFSFTIESYTSDSSGNDIASYVHFKTVNTDGHKNPQAQYSYCKGTSYKYIQYLSSDKFFSGSFTFSTVEKCKIVNRCLLILGNANSEEENSGEAIVITVDRDSKEIIETDLPEVCTERDPWAARKGLSIGDQA